MRKLQHRAKDALPYIALFVLTFVICRIFIGPDHIFGAKVDWISQHSVLPDYFRQQFYETGKLFPEFALHIGGGQNIYNFAYYGLYSPLILPSYLLPWMKMSDYMMALQFLGLAASVLLLYRWLVRKTFSRRISAGIAVVFLLSGPMIYHSYNQIMFVNYMPFLMLGLIATDRYFETAGIKKTEGGGFLLVGGQKAPLAVAVFFMILTSFYFSIGGMLVLVLYGVYRYIEIYLKSNQKVSALSNIKNFFANGVLFLLPFFTAVFMSAVLLVPTALALTGRDGGGSATEAVRLLLPHFSADRFFYTPYGIGLTTLAVTAVISILFFGKCHERILAGMCVVVLSFPLFAYLLNGGLYIRDKVMIPFLPLLCYMTAVYIRTLEQKDWTETEGQKGKKRGFSPKWMWTVPYLCTFFLVCFCREARDVGKYWFLIGIDALIMLVMFLPFCRRKKIVFLLFPPILFLGCYGAVLHEQADKAEELAFYEEVTDDRLKEVINQTAEKETGFYRMEQLGTDKENAASLNRIFNDGQYVSSIYSSSYNKEYQNFRRDVFQLEMPFRNCLMQSAVSNPVYQKFMGVRHVVEKEGDGWTVRENAHVFPIAYASDTAMTEKEYRQLEYPYNQLAFLQGAVISKKQENMNAPDAGWKEDVFPVDVKLPDEIHAEKNETKRFTLSRPEGMQGEKEEVLFLQFAVENQKPEQDISVWVEGIRNKLTARSHFYYNENTVFSYAVPLEKGQKEWKIKFGKGDYIIHDVRCFLAELPDQDPDITEFHLNKEQIEGNVIAGEIRTKTDGYFITSIPYDKHFEIRIDGKEVKTEKVNVAFLGCRLAGGNHQIRITYHAPGVDPGKGISAAGIVLFLILIWFDKKKKLGLNTSI